MPLLLKNDDELFGAIPCSGGPSRRGNLTGGALFDMQPTLAGVYNSAIDRVRAEDFSFELSKTVSINYDDDDDDGDPYDPFASDVQARFSKKKKEVFSTMENVIDRHLDDYNGYIGEFPPDAVKLYVMESNRGETFDLDFDYFWEGRTESRMLSPIQRAHALLHPDEKSKVLPHLLLLLLAGVMFLAVLISRNDGLFQFIPGLTERLLANESETFEAIYMGAVMVAILGFGIVFPRHFTPFGKDIFCIPVVVIAGACLIIFGGGYAVLPLMEDSDNFIIRGIWWILVVYYGLILLMFLIQAISTFASFLAFCSHRKQYRIEFVKAVDKHAQRVHRYLRLLTLWYGYNHNMDSPPYWVTCMSAQLKSYVSERNKLAN